MALLMDSTQQFKKSEYQSFMNSSNTRRRNFFFVLWFLFYQFYEASIILIPKPQRTLLEEKKKSTSQYTGEYGCMNSQQTKFTKLLHRPNTIKWDFFQ